MRVRVHMRVCVSWSTDQQMPGVMSPRARLLQGVSWIVYVYTLSSVPKDLKAFRRGRQWGPLEAQEEGGEHTEGTPCPLQPPTSQVAPQLLLLGVLSPKTKS